MSQASYKDEIRRMLFLRFMSSEQTRSNAKMRRCPRSSSIIRCSKPPINFLSLFCANTICTYNTYDDASHEKALGNISFQTKHFQTY